ncbi:hypothetical protein GJ744_001994 [Endocarpon pusillum]|uniref:Uncharacterized protein n=1 Tax=Endocarpon pusillum TaxID=364733 RepID=A0A8H7E0S8_9EURO|nr:hypothetical protein GJ744_001994 [Endocarpon pusillum]
MAKIENQDPDPNVSVFSLNSSFPVIEQSPSTAFKRKTLNGTVVDSTAVNQLEVLFCITAFALAVPGGKASSSATRACRGPKAIRSLHSPGPRAISCLQAPPEPHQQGRLLGGPQHIWVHQRAECRVPSYMQNAKRRRLDALGSL